MIDAMSHLSLGTRPVTEKFLKNLLAIASFARVDGRCVHFLRVAMIYFNDRTGACFSAFPCTPPIGSVKKNPNTGGR